jgi:hypothetical protein
LIPVSDDISALHVGQPQSFRNLTVFPIFRTRTDASLAPGYVLLDDAIAAGTARVTELHEGGSVPELRFENRGDIPVLLLDGEELIGAKQNRVLNLTILAPAKSTIVIPVSCVEAGRWDMASSEFKPAAHVMYSRVRAARAAQVTESLRSTGARRSDQSAVWNDIAVKSLSLDTDSRTSAMAEIYERNAITINEYIHSFVYHPDQCGVAFAVANGATGLDLFDHSATMKHYFPKLMKSFALDAMDTPAGKSEGLTNVSEFLARVASAQSFSEPALGLGKDIRLSSPGISGAALWVEDRYLHLCAFRSETSSQLDSRVARPSRRWR